jgi:hypothetical protein
MAVIWLKIVHKKQSKRGSMSWKEKEKEKEKEKFGKQDNDQQDSTKQKTGKKKDDKKLWLHGLSSATGQVAHQRYELR